VVHIEQDVVIEGNLIPSNCLKNETQDGCSSSHRTDSGWKVLLSVARISLIFY
jgi:hypothetical protein